MPSFRTSAAIVIGLVAVLAAGAFLIGPPPGNGPTTSAEAIANAQAETMQVTDPVHSRPFDVSVWAPSATTDRNELVLISHGFSGDRTSHSDLAQALAATGYTVAAPTHPDVAGLQSDDALLDPLVLRPRHLSLTIDALETAAGKPFTQVTALGHSLGSYSALRLAGAEPVLDGTLDAHCTDTADVVLCNPNAASRFETVAANATDLTDSRVDHVVLLAPAYGPLFGVDGPTVATDVLVVQATNDAELPGDQVTSLIDQLSTDSVHSVTSSVVDGGHYVFLRPCTDAEMSTVPAICEDAPGIDRSAMHRELSNQIVSFLQS